MNKTQLDKTLGTIKNYVDKKSYITSRGNTTAESGTTYPTQKGLSMTQAYNNSYPISYGNVMTMYGSGVSQLLIGWSGTSGAHEKAYIRSKRDTNDANYSGWAQIYTSAHPQPSVTGSSGSCTGNATTATKLATARTINGTSFDGSANITTAKWGTTRYINRTSVDGSADVKLPLDYITCGVSDNNTNNYHLILESGQVTSDYTDKSIVIMVCNHYNSNSFGIAKATLRTNKASGGDTAQAELIWIVRCGFAANVLCYNIRNTAKDTYMDVFYKSTSAYNSATIYILGEGARSNQSLQWTKNNTNASGTKAYTETAMKALRSYTSTLVSAVDSGVVNKANQLTTARNITIGNKTNSFNGTGNISFTLADIGAAPASHGTHVSYGGNGSATTVSRSDHTHSYLPLSGGTLTGPVTVSGESKFHNGTYSDPLSGTICAIKASGNVAVGGTIYEGGTSLSNKYAPKSHTHKYAGSSSAGGVANSSYKLEVKANNTITSTANDTTANWGAHGNSVHWYTNTGQLINQPSQWGYLLNIGRDNEVHQIWMEQAAGNLLHRGGNAQGWGTTWKTLVDSSNYASFITPAGIGAAEANHGNHVPLNCGSVSNWNDALYNGWYMASGAANQPAGDSNTWYMGQVLCHNTNYVIQILHQFASNGGDASKTPIFIRKKFNGSWGGWTSNFAINITGSSTGLQTSSFTPMGAGSSTQPVYFSNGIPVAGKSYYAKSTAGDIGWERVDSYAPVTVSAIAFWNGAYSGSHSNLAYCNQGAFGNIVTKNQGDYAPASHNHTVLTGEVKINNADGSFNDAWHGQGCALKVGGHMAIGGTTLTSGEYRSYSANAFRAVQGDYGFFIRNDGSHTYFMLTNPGDQYGNWNNFRPIIITNSTGEAIVNGTINRWNGYTMRTGAGLGGQAGSITFSW